MSNKVYELTVNEGAYIATEAPGKLVRTLREIWLMFRIQFAEVRDEWVILW